MRIRIISPQYGSIFQRGNNDKANIPIKVKWFIGSEVKMVATLSSGEDVKTGKILMEGGSVELKQISRNTFEGNFSATKGPWYTLIIEATRNNKVLGRKVVTHIGVGDIFLMAGQSNSANSGGAKMKAQSGMVMTLGKKKWKIAQDPQPLATGKGGSPWAPMGDELVKIWHHPIGLVSVGVGGSGVGEWDPEKGQLYPRMKNALTRLKPYGVRAVLWHQGETDATLGTPIDVYKHALHKVIKQSRTDWGRTLPWIIARASFVPDETVPKEYFQQVRTAQTEICAEVQIFPGPDTDQILGKQWRHDLLHFGREGLPRHGRLWAQVILNLFGK